MNPLPHDSDGADVVAVLLRAGGRREVPPEEAYRAVLAAAESALQDKLRRRRLWRFGWALAAAAALGVVAVGLRQHILPPAAPPAVVSVASVDRLDGLVEGRDSEDARWAAVNPARPLTSGSLVRTGRNSGAGLLLQQQLSLRIAAESEVELTDPQRIRLLRGAIYVDAAPEGSARLVVATPLGSVRHVGTQFEVRNEPTRLRVLVREGLVQLDRDSGPLQVSAGEGLVVDVAGDVVRLAIEPHDPAWRWTQALAPMPEFDERPASDLLTWVARQTGRTLHYVTPQAEQRAATIILHGQFERMAPLQALEVTQATTDLVIELKEDGRVSIGTR